MVEAADCSHVGRHEVWPRVINSDSTHARTWNKGTFLCLRAPPVIRQTTRSDATARDQFPRIPWSARPFLRIVMLHYPQPSREAADHAERRIRGGCIWRCPGTVAVRHSRCSGTIAQARFLAVSPGCTVSGTPCWRRSMSRPERNWLAQQISFGRSESTRWGFGFGDTTLHFHDPGSAITMKKSRGHPVS